MSMFRLSALTKATATLRQRIKLPDRYKGTIVEKWAKYWEGLILDYGEVVRDSVKECRQKPKKALKIFGLSTFLAVAFRNNPDEISFRDRVTYYGNEFGLVGAPIRNLDADEHLRRLGQYYNSGVLGRFSLGFVSVMWVDNFDAQVGLYKAQCDYLKPKYLNLYERVVDVGFMGKWWVLERRMKDFDVNNDEWTNFSGTPLEYS